MAGMIPRQFIDDLLSRVDIVDVVHTSVPLRKAGKNYSACCPFHDEKTPSFTVSPEKQFYHCFGCGAHGNAISFLMEYENQEFVDAIETLAHQAGLEVPREEGAIESNARSQYRSQVDLLAQVSDVYQKQLQHASGQVAREYLQTRGVSMEMVRQFEIGFAPPGWRTLTDTFATAHQSLHETGMLLTSEKGRVYDRFRERVMFPIKNIKGHVIGFGGRALGDATPKYLNSPETPVFHKGREVYGLYQAKQALRKLESLIVVEGYMDVIALAQHGIANAVATLGTASTSEHLTLLLRQVDHLIFSFDGDKAGKKAAWRALELVLSHLRSGRMIQFLFLPQGHDPDSFVRHFGRQGFEDAVREASTATDFLLDTMIRAVDLSRLDGRLQLVEKARPYLQKIEDKFYQHMVIEELAKRVRMDTETLKKNIFGQKRDTSVPTNYQRIRPTKKNTATLSKPSAIRVVLSLIVQHPELVKTIENWEALGALKMPGMSLLLEVVKLCQKHPDYKTSHILEAHRNTEEGKILAKLAIWQHEFLESGLENELRGAVKRLELLLKEQELEFLLEKSRKFELNKLEKSRLQALLTSREL